MRNYYLDAGTTWSKILEEDNGNKKYSIIPSSELKSLKDITFTKSTGHNFAHVKTLDHVNEVVALVKGCEDILKPNGIVLDLGSRDVKWAKFKDNKFQDMDWNASCASATGATVEMLLKFYNVNPKDLKATDEKYNITCGIFGLEKIMDDVSKGLDPNIAISKFIHGIAYNAYNFTKTPEKLYVSGGFCENDCFMDSLNMYTEAIPLGRYVLANGLFK